MLEYIAAALYSAQTTCPKQASEQRSQGEAGFIWFMYGIVVVYYDSVTSQEWEA